jgi:hypothetical protein
MDSQDFQESRIRLNLKVGDRVKFKLATEEEIYITFKLLDCSAMRGEYDEMINIGEIENNPGWFEPGYCGLNHLGEIISKL